MSRAASAMRTWSASASASEYTAIGEMPISRHARMTRIAISPRLAISSFLNTDYLRMSLAEGPGHGFFLTVVARPEGSSQVFLAVDDNRKNLCRPSGRYLCDD